MDKQLAFNVFCLESYKSVHGLTGLAALDIFKKHQVFEYITSCYDTLHSAGKLYIARQTHERIKRQKTPMFSIQTRIDHFKMPIFIKI